MFSRALVTALAVSLAATTVQALEQKRNESPERLEDLEPVVASTAPVPAYTVLSDKDRARENLSRNDLVTVTIVGTGSTSEERSSAGDR